jgi:putative redox protein
MIRASGLQAAYQTAFTNGELSAVADVPREKGGAGNGFGPHELLEAALATCLTMTVRMYAAKHALPLTGASCEVRIDRSVPGAVTLNYDLTLDGPLTPEQRRQLRDAAGRCPVANTLTGTIQLRQINATGGTDASACAGQPAQTEMSVPPNTQPPAPPL